MDQSGVKYQTIFLSEEKYYCIICLPAQNFHIRFMFMIFYEIPVVAVVSLISVLIANYLSIL